MGAFKAFGQWYPQQQVATISGFMVGLGASGGLAAATPLAWLNEQIGWRAIFLWAAPITLLSALAILLWTRNTPPGIARPTPGQQTGGLSQILRDIRFWRIAPLNFFLLGTALAVQGLWGGPYLLDVLALSNIAAGNLLLAMGVGVVAGYFVCGWLADRFGAQRVMLAGMLVFLLCQLTFVLPSQLPLAVRYCIFVVFGFTGSFNIVLLAQIRVLFPAHMSGRAVTAVNLFGFAGTALIQGWMGLVVGYWPRNDAGQYPPIAYAAAFASVALGTALALAWYIPLAWKRPSYGADPGSTISTS
jgi:predicted MFS family arabinose efflux permease